VFAIVVWEDSHENAKRSVDANRDRSSDKPTSAETDRDRSGPDDPQIDPAVPTRRWAHQFAA
jgi:hypothetical protein